MLIYGSASASDVVVSVVEMFSENQEKYQENKIIGWCISLHKSICDCESTTYIQTAALHTIQDISKIDLLSAFL